MLWRVESHHESSVGWNEAWRRESWRRWVCCADVSGVRVAVAVEDGRAWMSVLDGGLGPRDLSGE
jgi:hypothetical protein